MWLEVLLFIVMLVCWVVVVTRKPKNFPPGPSWLPLLGNLLYVKRLVDETGFHHLAWAKLAEQYGSVVGLKLGMTPPMILISGRSAVVEALNNEDLDGRPDAYLFKTRTMGKRRGVIFTDGQEWKEQRRFLLRNLRDFGFGKRCMETLILDEALACVNKLRTTGEQNGKEGIPMQEAFTVPVLNSLWSLIAGIRFDDNHPTLDKFVSLSNQLIRSVDSTGGFLNHLPGLRHIAPGLFGFTLFTKLQDQMWDFFKDFVDEHKLTISEDHSRDLIDVYLKELKTPSSLHHTEMQIVAIIKDLFGAGSETTSNTLSFAVLHLLLNPDVQAKAQREVDDVIGRCRLPSLEDKTTMPYLNAVLMEVQRISHVAPTTVPHRAMRDTHIGGYHVARDSTVLLSLWSVHMDVQRWGDPHVFRPERFLDLQGQLLAADTQFMPFGAGRRRCLGENMAKNTLFLFFAFLLQQVSFTLPPHEKPPSPHGVTGFTVMTVPFNAIVTDRTPDQYTDPLMF